jgi:biotin carboxylase
MTIMQKKIVIIGAGVEQAYAYHLARNSGHYIIATDVNPNAPAVELSDYFIKVSTKDAEKTLIALQEYCSENGSIDGVMTIANDVPYTVARVAEFFGLAGHSVDSALLARDKLRMKKAFKTNGVACPDFWEVHNVADLKAIVRQEKIDFFVLKPLDGCGARGVLLLKPTDDLDWAWRESLNWSEEHTLLLERFVPGLQISSESFLISGKANTPALSERNYSRLTQFSPSIIEDGGTIPPQISNSLKEKIDRLIEDGARAMGVSDGIVKGDIVIDENGNPLIIELALRLSGGWFASDQIIAATGVDLVKAVMSHALGESVSKNDLTPKKNKATSIRYWFPEPGKISKIHGEKQLQQTPGLLKYGFFRKPGEIQPTIRMHPDRFGYVLVEGVDRIEVVSRVEKAISCINVEMDCT